MDECLSVQLPFELQVHLLLEQKANLLDQNVNELEFELSRMNETTLYVSRSSFSLDPLENLRRLVSFSSSFVYE
jgi:hypothetical protein